MARLRDLGEAHVLSAAGNAIACRVSIAVADGEDGSGWLGQLRPYRPLALVHGRYTLRIRGENFGALTVQAVRSVVDGEVADFVGVGAPGEQLKALAARGSAPGRHRAPRFPRVGAEVEPTTFAALLTRVVAALRRPVTAPARRVSRRR